MTTSDPHPNGPAHHPAPGAAPDLPSTSDPASSGAAGSHSSLPAATPTPAARADDAFPVPHGPRTTGPGGHVLGVLIGLVLAAAAIVLLLLGQSRILAEGVGQESVSGDALGVTLVTVGAVLAALTALLSVRTSAIPFTGGLLALLVGGAFLFAPVATHDQTVRLLATQQNRDAVLTVVSAAMAGTPFVLGLVLLATATAAALVRRRGIAVGSFRARQAGQAAGDRS